MKACVIGGKGKVGNYLVPMLVQNGYDVTVVSRGQTDFFRDEPELKEIRELKLDHAQANFDRTIAGGGYDVIVDMILFEEKDMRRLASAVKGYTDHFVVCGSIWYHGPSNLLPVREEDCRNPVDHYGEQKLAMDDTVQRLYREEGFPGTIVHPGHICAPGHPIINPQGNANPQVFENLKKGKPILLPYNGMSTLHHVHAEDVAGIMMAAIRVGAPSFGQGFHAAARQAMSLNGYANHVAEHYGKKARLQYAADFENFRTQVGEEDAALTLEHITRSPVVSMEKVRRLLGYIPRTAFDTVDECLPE